VFCCSGEEEWGCEEFELGYDGNIMSCFFDVLDVVVELAEEEIAWRQILEEILLSMLLIKDEIINFFHLALPCFNPFIFILSIQGVDIR
jgi:hypothetical protein